MLVYQSPTKQNHFRGVIMIEHTGINSVEIVEIRRETKPVDRSVNVLLDMRSGVVHSALRSKDVKSTLRSNCMNRIVSQ